MRKKIAVVCLAIIAVFYLAGIFATWVTPYGYNDQNLSTTAVKQGPSLKHPFGTDRLGRDLLTRVIFGLRTTVIVTVTAMATGGLLLGIGLGLIAGYFGKMADAVIMRVGEVFLAFPGLLLVILIAATVKPRVLEWEAGVVERGEAGVE